MPLVFDEIDRIELPDGEWVDIRHRMQYKQRQALRSHYMKIQVKLEEVKKGTVVDLDLEAGDIMLLLLNILAWNIKDKDSNIALVSKETIEQLDPVTADTITEAIAKRNPVPKV